MPERTNFYMKNKQKAKILSFISLVLLISTGIFGYIVIESDLNIEINPISAACIYPLLLLSALLLSIIAVGLNKKQILGWVILILVLIPFIMSIYLFMGLGNLPLGAGTR